MYLLIIFIYIYYLYNYVLINNNPTALITRGKVITIYSGKEKEGPPVGLEMSLKPLTPEDRNILKVGWKVGNGLG